MKPPTKPAGWKIRNEIFWMNDKGKTGVRYMCRHCGKRTLGMGSARQMHFNSCSHAPALTANPTKQGLFDSFKRR